MGKSVVNNVFWRFDGEKYNDYDKFVAAVTAYNKKISPENSKWEPEQVISKGPITVIVEADWRDEDDLLEVEIGEPKQPVTMGCALFELQNATIKILADADHCFFEGLESAGKNQYGLMLGS